MSYVQEISSLTLDQVHDSAGHEEVSLTRKFGDEKYESTPPE